MLYVAFAMFVYAEAIKRNAATEKKNGKRPRWLDRLKKETLFYIWNYEFTCNSINRYTIIDDTSLKFY